jgi:hypothetical protein
MKALRCNAQTRINAAGDRFEASTGFDMFMLKAVIRRRGDALVDLK